MRRAFDKPKLAIFGAAACGGCEMALLACDDFLFYLKDSFDLVFCRAFLDTKMEDLAKCADGEISVTLFSGAVRMHADITMARLLRRVSQTLVAFGSCAQDGGVLGLADINISEKLPCTDNRRDMRSCCRIIVEEGSLWLPSWTDRLMPLSQTVFVDYSVPGCPPEPHRITDVLHVLTDKTSHICSERVLGAATSTVCVECSRDRGIKLIDGFYHMYEKTIDPNRCFLDQGILCMGVATRGGCGGLCLKANMPCSGCYGAPEGITDQGVAIMSALASVLDIGRIDGLSADAIASRIDAVIDDLLDPVGVFWKYGFARSILVDLRRRPQ
jgi:F420-non-reducing hydrogenase small subunit